MTPEQFFSKNLKYITIVLLFLLCIKSIQSCNRKTQLNMTRGQYIQTIDSLEKKYYNILNQYDDTTKMLKFELRMANEKTKGAEKNAADIKSIVEKRNTNIYNIIPKVDTIKRK